MFSLRKNGVGAEVYQVSLVYQPIWLLVLDRRKPILGFCQKKKLPKWLGTLIAKKKNIIVKIYHVFPSQITYCRAKAFTIFFLIACHLFDIGGG